MSSSTYWFHVHCYGPSTSLCLLHVGWGALLHFWAFVLHCIDTNVFVDLHVETKG